MLRVQIILFFELKFTFLNNNCNVSNWVNMVIIQKPLVMQQKIGVESEFLDSQVQISTPNQKKPNTYSCCLYNGIMYAN